MKIKMTIDECLEFADNWVRGVTLHENSQGWRVVCMLLAEEVRKLRAQVQQTTVDTSTIIKELEVLLQLKNQSWVLAESKLKEIIGAASSTQHNTAEEPELPKGVAWMRPSITENGIVYDSSFRDENGMVPPETRIAQGFQPLYNAAQMHDHFQAGVRAGAAGSQDAKRYQYAMDWNVKNFAVCMRIGNEAWIPVKTNGPIDKAMKGDKQ